MPSMPHFARHSNVVEISPRVRGIERGHIENTDYPQASAGNKNQSHSLVTKRRIVDSESVGEIGQVLLLLRNDFP